MNFEGENEPKNLAMQGDNEAPALYQVYLYNDDYTPQEFVLGLLEKLFYMNRRKASEVMLEAHMQGKALCGTFSKDFAEAKVFQVIEYARNHDHPLSCSTEAA